MMSLFLFYVLLIILVAGSILWVVSEYSKKQRKATKSFIRIEQAPKRKTILPLTLLLISCLTFSLTINAQSSTYSNQSFGIEMTFPSGWQLVSQPQLANAIAIVTARDIKLDSSNGDTEAVSIIVYAAKNVSTLAVHSMVIASEKIVEASSEIQPQDYLVYGIELLRKEGMQIPRFTSPIEYRTAKGISFYTCAMEKVIEGSECYQRTFVVRRKNDFLIIAGSFPNENDDVWMTEIVDSIVITE